LYFVFLDKTDIYILSSNYFVKLKNTFREILFFVLETENSVILPKIRVEIKKNMTFEKIIKNDESSISVFSDPKLDSDFVAKF
jgi:hypothetical protein